MRNSKTYLLATTLLAGVAFTSPAFAQAAPNSTTTPPNPQAQPELNSAATDQTPATQENPADTAALDRQDTEKNSGETIVVTGSRIVSPNITSLAPVQVIGEQQIKRAGAINIQEVLNQNPAIGTPALSTTATTFSTSGIGIAGVDLRELGLQRTLVLINGRRAVGGIQGSPVVDLNVIPTQFLERVDVLTGGASSLYGSDAVAGVINFIYKRNFEGLLAEGQYGLSERGDAQRYQISATVGSNLMGGRGNIMFHLGYSNDKGLLARSRANTRVDDISLFNLTGDPATFGQNVEPFFSSYVPQGRFNAGGYSFTYGPTGQLQPCVNNNGPTCASGLGTGTGPNGFNRQYYRTLSTPVERYLFAERSNFDITDNISFITEATFAKTSASTRLEPFPLDSANVFPIDAQVPIQVTPGGPCNPYVPAIICSVATDTNGDGLKDMSFRRRLADAGIGPRTFDANRNFFRFVTGFEGNILNERFHWDVTYNYGQSDEQQHGNGQFNVANFRNALNAVVDANGNVICADATARAEGCVPINIFGVNSITPAAAAYVAADTQHSFKVSQQVWNANISGSLFDLPGGPLGVAVGAEYRKEASTEDWDALTNAGLNGGNALPDTSGKFDVKEVYGEVNLPILKDLPFAEQLNLRAAGRLSDYSTVGSVRTWSLGGDWAPISDIRFRATLAQATRAPNIGELFTGPSQTFPALADPCEHIGVAGGGALGDNCRAATGVLGNINANAGNPECPADIRATGCFVVTQPDRQGISGFLSGNPNLGPETSKSLTAGVVIAPRSIPALRNLVLSVDYFRYKITDVINITDGQTILNQCYRSGNPIFCAFITRFPQQTGGSSSGALRFVNSGAVNSAVKTERGIDTVLSYRTGLDSLMGGLTMNANIAWSHYFTGYIIPLAGVAANPFVGEVPLGSGGPGMPKDKANANLVFNTSKFGLSLTGTYIGKMYLDNVYLANFGLDPHAISIKPQFYMNGQVNFTPVRTYEFFVGVNNLLDHKAPNIFTGDAGNTGGSDTNANVYDVFGRSYYGGVRLRF